MNKCLKEDIDYLKEIHRALEDNYDDEDWVLRPSEEEKLYRITGLDVHDWDESSLAHFIDGMQRAEHLLEIYEGIDK